MRSPLRIPAPRLRGALVAALSALAATALAAPASAGAAEETPTSLEISCVPSTLETGSVTSCLATASSPNGAPAGAVRWSVARGFHDLGTQLCELKPISGKASTCSMPITGYVKGEEKLAARYFSSATSGVKATDTEIVSFQGGSLQVECSPQPSVSKDPVECVVRVPSTADETAAPSGDVAFRAISRFGSHKQQIQPQCALQPAPGGASCTVIYTPAFVEGTGGGESAVLAEYEGDAEHPAEDGTGLVEVSRIHQVEMLASCEYTEPVLRTNFNCGATVENLSNSGGAPTGRLRVINEGLSAGFFQNLNPCNLKPVIGEPKLSTCAVAYQTIRLGTQELNVSYEGNESFEPAFEGGILLNVKEGVTTSTDVDCQQVQAGKVGRCFVSVQQVGIPGADPTQSPPLGVVNFQASPASPPIEWVGSFACELEPLKFSMHTSRCAISYRPTNIGVWTFRANYEGSAAKHALSSGKTTVSAHGPLSVP